MTIPSNGLLALLLGVFLIGLNVGVVLGPRHPPQPRSWTTQRDGIISGAVLLLIGIAMVLAANV